MLLVLLSPRTFSERFGAGARPVHPILRHSVTLRAPHECADTYYLMSGRKVSVPPDRLVAMTVEDSKPLLSIGWTTQNNLEIR